MREIPKQFLLMLIALALLVLPLHSARAMGAHKSASFNANVVQDTANGCCVHAAGSHDTGDCDNHSSSDQSVDNCCDDNCSGAQLFFAQESNFQFVPAKGFELLWSQQMPDPIAYIEYRPPILIS